MSLLVASIDFGTTYSGWAFSFRHEFESDPTKVSAKNWSGGQLVSQKGPTCVLIRPDGKTLEEFGYEAENKYAELAMDECHKPWYYFRRFKMKLFNQGRVGRTLMLEDETGTKSLPANIVFSGAIKYLKNDLIKQSEKRISGGGLTDADINWVLTVPAIWDDAAKQFMREAAEEAGIAGDKLTIALEPEAASVFCRHLPVDTTASSVTSLASFKAGTKYLVLDAGGGTVDITVHEVSESGELKELYKANGGAWGGTKVDDAYEKFLVKITGPGVMAAFKENHMEDYIDLFRDFEIKKRDISTKKSGGKINLRMPVALVETVKEVSGKTIKETIVGSAYRERIKHLGDKIRVDADLVIELFEEPVTSILNHVSTLLKESAVRGCNKIVMVGGFSESPILQERVKERFSGMSVIVPNEAGLAVLKGAVIFGHSPTAIAERVCKLTYGYKASHLYKKTCSHPTGRCEKDKNEDLRCYDIFTIQAKAGENVKLSQEGPESTFTPVSASQTTIALEIYASLNPNPSHTTEQRCSKIGYLNIPIDDTSLGKDREFGIRFIFGGTELEVKVEDKADKRVFRKRVDFLG
ncbi:heat shock 70 kDa protein 12B-like [Mya arenaria]|uniref:heat shock 70 kDa protein 12B-like n=1 Tax=Mya arenaria TaxID=6604 RepID=UPI0022E65409|nr:heat shock 70 kDa protein 12B-like [Mya arenaria]XP_052778300.1 heat shock 70 kDa protein 12B-like [Mya arenaria]